jgi:hypothetical protein
LRRDWRFTYYGELLMGTSERRPRTRVRVIIDNDFSGDPDDLFQLAHHVLSLSVHIPLVVHRIYHPGIR